MASPGRISVVKGGPGSVATPANNIGGDSTTANRRGSAGSSSGTMFSGLMNQKRNSGDASAAARRESFNEMKPQAGIIGNMWNKFTTGGYK